MIKELCDLFIDSIDVLKEKLANRHPKDYDDLLKMTIECMNLKREKTYDDENILDPSSIHAIYKGSYSGTLIYIIHDSCAMPHNYWYTWVDYGSCSACDTFESIKNYEADEIELPTQSQIDDYVTLALHMIQRTRKLEVGL